MSDYVKFLFLYLGLIFLVGFLAYKFIWVEPNGKNSDVSIERDTVYIIVK